MNIGTITITLEGASIDDTERCRRIINLLFEQGFFATRNGPATVHFDPNGLPSKIEIPKVWMRDKPPIPLAQSFTGAKIEIIKQFSKQT